MPQVAAQNSKTVGTVNPPGNSSINIAANASTQVKTGAGTLASLNINTGGTTSTVTFYDGTSTAGKKLGTLPTTAVTTTGQIAFNFAFTTGLFMVTAGGAAADITIGYR